MNSEREKADILFNYGLPLQFCCHLIQFYTVLSLRTATLIQALNKVILICFNTCSTCVTVNVFKKTANLYVKKKVNWHQMSYDKYDFCLDVNS